MSKRAPNAADELYSNHLYGKMRHANNSASNRLALIERMYFRILSELAVNRFKWQGLPEEIDVRFMELTLYYHALSVFYHDRDYDKYFALQGSGNGPINMLQNPTAFNVVGNGFVSKTIPATQCVPIWANYLRVPDLDIVMVYATKLAEIDQTIEINTKSARRTKIVFASENQRLSVSNIIRQIDEGQSLVTVSGALSDMEFVKALDLGVDPDTINALHILRTRLWNEGMGLLGIENANQDKKERLVSAEVDANNDQTSMMRYVNLNARRKAADDISKMFKFGDVTVEYNTEVERQAAQALDAAESEPENTNTESKAVAQ